MTTFIFATRNPGKAKEVREMLAPLGIAVETLADRPEFEGHDPEETGTTFRDNAVLKAREAARICGLPVIADDSGLEVDALDGAPGVYSARYAGEPKSDEANNRKLIEALRGVPAERRTARFRCALALFVPQALAAEYAGVDAESVVEPGGVANCWSGAVEGRIVDDARGENGFGYDPHFLLPDRGRTTAELAPDEKHAISHRGKAVRQMGAALTRR